MWLVWQIWMLAGVGNMVCFLKLGVGWWGHWVGLRMIGVIRLFSNYPKIGRNWFNWFADFSTLLLDIIFTSKLIPYFIFLRISIVD